MADVTVLAMTSRLVPTLLAAGALLATAACPRPPPPKPPPEEEQLAPRVRAIAREAEELLRAQQELLWKHWTQGAPLDIGQTYEGKQALFGRDSIQQIERLRQLTRDEREVRALTYLHAHLVGEHLSGALAEMTDAFSNLQASITFTLDGKELPYRDLERLLANEKSAERRYALSEAAVPAVQRLSVLLERKEEKIQVLLPELGYGSYEALGAELRQADLGRLGLLAEQVLQVTQRPSTEVMDRLAQRELKLPLAKLRRADVPRLFRLRGVDALFPKEALLPRAEATLKGMGLELARLPNVRVDLSEPVAKVPHPLTLPVEVPGDVRLSFKPGPGVRQQAALLHELGLALAYGLSTEKRFELAKLGNGAVAESYAYLLEDLVEDPLWLEEHAGLTGEKLAEYLAATSAYQLYRIRRAAGRLLYQLQARRGDPQDARALYSALMERTYGFPMGKEDEERYLLELEDFYESADDFRAWFLAGQLQAQLKARFGPAWWRDARAGDFLKSLWTKGNALTVSELARLAGEDGLRPDALLLRLGANLQVPITIGTESNSAPAAPPPAATPESR